MTVIVEHNLVMGVSEHLGIRVREYDRRIRTFIPDYETMLRVAASAVPLAGRRAPTVVDLGTGTGGLAAQVLAVVPRAHIVGIELDETMLAIAHRRLGDCLTSVTADFLRVPLPKCDAMTASFSLHHIATTRQKRALYQRCARALGRGGLLVSADCFPSTDAQLQRRDRAAWLAHLERHYPATKAAAFLRAWAREDHYVPLDIERRLLNDAGFDVDVLWRKGSFAVVVAFT